MFGTDDTGDRDIFGNRPNDVWGNTPGGVHGDPPTNVWDNPVDVGGDSGVGSESAVDAIFDWLGGIFVG